MVYMAYMTKPSCGSGVTLVAKHQTGTSTSLGES